MTEDQLIKAIKAHVEKGDQAKGKSEQHYASAGQYLKTLRKDSSSKAAWEKLVKNRCGIGTSRAYELIQIADGRKTVADVRLAKAESVRKLRSRPLRSGQNKAEPAAATDEQKNLPAGLEPEIEIEPERKSEPVMTAAAADKHEILRVRWEYLAYQLISENPNSARELYRLLREDDGTGVHVLEHALGNRLNGGHVPNNDYPWIERVTEPAPSEPTADDYPDMPEFPRRTSEAA
jgi:hypothetical protein